MLSYRDYPTYDSYKRVGKAIWSRRKGIATTAQGLAQLASGNYLGALRTAGYYRAPYVRRRRYRKPFIRYKNYRRRTGYAAYKKINRFRRRSNYRSYRRKYRYRY